MKPFGRVSRQCTSAICLIALLATSFVHAFSQEAAPKRPLSHQDYDSWHSILSPQISRDGKFVAYPVFENGVDNVWIQPIDGSPGHQITRFNSERILQFHWSPDSKRLGILRGHTDSDVVLLQESKP